MRADPQARYEPVERKQFVLETVDVEQLIAENHTARNIWSLLSRMDLSRFASEVKAVEGHAGRNAWEPRLLIAIWLYSYSRGISSARQIERECRYEPGLRWLLGLKSVNHPTLSDFRVEQGAALQDLFKQVLGLMMMEKRVTLERVTVDGTKVRAAVNKKTFSRKDKINAHLQAAEKHLTELRQQEAEQEKRGRQAAAQRRAARERVSRLESALKEVEELQKEKKNDRQKPCQASRTDADAQFMQLSDHGVAPAYNVQLVADAQNKLIVDVEVSKHPNDALHLAPALERVHSAHGRYPRQVIADGDYTNRAALRTAAEYGVDYYGSWHGGKQQKMAHGIAEGYEPKAFVYDEAANQMTCPAGQHLKLLRIEDRKDGVKLPVYAAQRADCQACAQRAFCTPNNAMKKRGRTVSRPVDIPAMHDYHAKMATAEARTIYQQRAPVAEFPHAWMKDKLNWRRVRCRGRIKVKAEALWAALTYNLQRYFKLSVSFKPALA